MADQQKVVKRRKKKEVSLSFILFCVFVGWKVCILCHIWSLQSMYAVRLRWALCKHVLLFSESIFSPRTDFSEFLIKKKQIILFLGTRRKQ